LEDLEGCRIEDDIKMYVKETVTSCRMDSFGLEHGPVTGCCEVGNEHGFMLFCEFLIDQLLRVR
jgi:hypothetical protein